MSVNESRAPIATCCRGVEMASFFADNRYLISSA